jgi:hypothetical protein
VSCMCQWIVIILSLLGRCTEIAVHLATFADCHRHLSETFLIRHHNFR